MTEEQARQVANYFYTPIEKVYGTSIDRRILDQVFKPDSCEPSVEYCIKRVIFNPPATIVFWKDGSKTVVKCCSDETFDKEKGLAMAILKKLGGNRSNYFNKAKKWLKEDE